MYSADPTLVVLISAGVEATTTAADSDTAAHSGAAACSNSPLPSLTDGSTIALHPHPHNTSGLNTLAGFSVVLKVPADLRIDGNAAAVYLTTPSGGDKVEMPSAPYMAPVSRPPGGQLVSQMFLLSDPVTQPRRFMRGALSQLPYDASLEITGGWCGWCGWDTRTADGAWLGMNPEQLMTALPLDMHA